MFILAIMSTLDTTAGKPEDKRRKPRIPIKDHFSLRLLIPSICGSKKLRIKDMTSTSLRFAVDEEDSVKIGKGENIEARLYMDTMTYINVTLKIAHKKADNIGCEFIKPKPETVSAIEYYLEYVKIASEHFNSKNV